MARKAVIRVATLFLVGLLVLTGCVGSKSTQGSDGPTIKLGYKLPEEMKPARQIHDFQLIDHEGRPFFFQAPYKEVTVAYFGYTFCPDACPMTLGVFRQIINALGPDAHRVQFLFFTVDPDRDTPERMAQYLENFHPQIIGLTGDEATIAEVAENWGVLYERREPEGTSADYLVDHTASTFFVDSEGVLRYRAQHGTEPEPLVDLIRNMLPERPIEIEGAWVRAASALGGSGHGHEHGGDDHAEEAHPEHGHGEAGAEHQGDHGHDDEAHGDHHEHHGHGDATSAAYLTIKNKGDVADTLIAAASPVAEVVELHNMWFDENDVMRMEPVAGIEVPAGGEAVLNPGGFHIMLIGLHHDLHEGDEVELTLTFERAGTFQVIAPVKGP